VNLPAVRVNRRAVERLDSGHPWVFASDVVDRGHAQPGDAVILAEPGGRALGTAHYSSSSQICLRLLSRRVEAIDRAFLLGRLQAAADYRSRVVRDSDAYRLAHGEGDRLPGLVIDRYRDVFVIQTLDQGMDRLRSEIASCLQELFAPRGILARNDSPVRRHEQLPLVCETVAGEIPDEIPVRMNGLDLTADVQHGQKTGVFLDQRDNYIAAARYGRGRALDCFTCTGGFALHLAPGCESVEAVDSSAPALGRARRNAERNGIANIQFREADVFELLTAYASARRQFETIILDPPAFAKSRSQADAAARGYKDINLRALRLLGPGGVLVSCSCSHHVSEALLLETIAAASLNAGRMLRVLERRTQAQDHPILLTVPETLYLKCLILEVV